jgi:hypothetical protein
VKVCPICGKDDLKHQGALNMHMYHCRMKNVSRETIEQKENVKEECQHSFRLLSVSSPIEAKAYKNGYMEVCRTCQELR